MRWQVGIAVKDITFIAGTVYKTKDISGIYDGIELPSYEEIEKTLRQLMRRASIYNTSNTDPFVGKVLIEGLSGRHLCGTESAARSP